MANRESVDAKLVEGWEEARAHGPGAFFFDKDDKHILMVLPGDTELVAIPIDGSRGWRWDGNREKPSVTPSILAYERQPGPLVERWHGYMRAGRLESC